MRHLRFILLSLLFGAGIASQAQTNAAQADFDSTLIQVQIEGIPAGKTRLVGIYGDRNYLADSADVDANGRFEIRRKEPLPAGFYTFLLPGGNKNFSILIDQDQRFTLRAKADDIANTMQVNGSVNTDLFYKNAMFQAKQDPEIQRTSELMKNNPEDSPAYQQAKARQNQILDERKAHLDEIYAKYPDAFFTKFKQAGQNPELTYPRKPNGDLDTLAQLLQYRSQFWENVDFTDERLLRTPVVGNKLRRYIKEMVPQNRDSIIPVADELIRRVLPHKPYFQFFANWIALQYENTKTTVMDGEAVYVHVVKNFFTPELAFWDKPENLEKLQKHVWEMEASLLWKKGADVRAKDILTDKERSIYELTAPIVVVFMFSPDCEHCQKDAPKIQTIARNWKSRGVDFFGIGVSTTAEELKTFTKKHGFDFPVVFDPTNRAIYAKYFVDITPELYILNKDRIIVAKNLKAEQLEEVFQREINKLK
ncbi:MAG: redoxin domain-containing protein [Saprospiraceae bacterium]|nr:redoxin domain-containing protein [Saprospiraceae bacterium]